jgi:hypothetical protein
MYEIERRTGRSVRPVGEPLIDSGAEEPALASAPDRHIGATSA